MMKRSAIVVAWLVACCLGMSVAQAQSYDHEMEGKGMTFSWKIDGDMLHGKMSAKTEGWVAVGFNPSDKMKDGNYIIGFVKGGEVTLADHFGNRSAGHDSDTKLGGSEDVTLVSGTEEKGFTTIEFTIPLDSGDEYDQPISADGDTIVMLAYGPKRDSLRVRHRYNESFTVDLGTGAVK